MVKLPTDIRFLEDTTMTEKSKKPLPDLKTFIENMNKKDTVRNGKKIRFGFTKRKRRTRKVRMKTESIGDCGFFSSDRTIQQYCDDIWGVKPVKVGGEN